MKMLQEPTFIRIKTQYYYLIILSWNVESLTNSIIGRASQLTHDPFQNSERKLPLLPRVVIS